MPTTPTPLIPRSVLFGNPRRALVKLSPDGRFTSWLAPVDGVLNVWVAPTDDLQAARAVTDAKVRDIRSYGWAYDGIHLLYVQDAGGDENWVLHAVDVERGVDRPLTPTRGVHAQLVALVPDQPTTVMVALNDRVPELHDLYRLDLVSGERSLVIQNDGWLGFELDSQMVPRMATRMRPDGGLELHWLGEDLKPTGEYMAVPQEDSLTTGPVGFDVQGRLYLLDSRGRDTGALFRLDGPFAEAVLLAEDAKADASEVVVHPQTLEPQAVAFTYDRRRYTVLDPELSAHLERLAQIAPGEVQITSRTLDDRQWIVAYTLDDGPIHYYRYDTERLGAQLLFTNRPELQGQPLVSMRPLVLTARDGLPLVSYLSLPAEVTGPDGEASRPVPLVLLVHGGPWARDGWGYLPEHQWLANRGYAVLSVNFRGSTGFGKSFLNAGDGEWAGQMHDDLLDAVQWAVARGIAQPEKVAIMGGSYGGYATLVGLTFTPEVFACGVDIVGPSSLITLIESVPPYWKPMIEQLCKRVGDYRTEEGRAFLQARSPLHRADQIVRPLLIAQGANDPRVKQAEADQIVEAMQQRKIPVTYLLYPDEGHGFARPVNDVSFRAVAEAFLAEVLGGRAEPWGDALDGTSLQVPVGAEHVPGLSERLGSAS